MAVPGIPPHQPQVVKKPTNPWFIIGWIIVGGLVLCGGGCGAVAVITALGSSTTTTSPNGTAPTTAASQQTTTTTTAPTVQPVGTPIVASSGDTITVHTIADPYTSTNQFIEPDPGNRFVVLDVEACAGAQPSDANMFDWTLVTDTNRKYQLSMGDAQPQFTEPPGPGDCTRGFVTYEVLVAESVTEIRYDDEIGWWTIAPPGP